MGSGIAERVFKHKAFPLKTGWRASAQRAPSGSAGGPPKFLLTHSPALDDDRDRGSAMNRQTTQTTRAAASATLFALPLSRRPLSRRTRPGPRQQGQHLGKGYPRQQPGRPAIPTWRHRESVLCCAWPKSNRLSDQADPPPWRCHHGAVTCEMPVLSGGFPDRPRHGELTPHRLPPPRGPPTSRSPPPPVCCCPDVEDVRQRRCCCWGAGVCRPRPRPRRKEGEP